MAIGGQRSILAMRRFCAPTPTMANRWQTPIRHHQYVTYAQLCYLIIPDECRAKYVSAFLVIALYRMVG